MNYKSKLKIKIDGDDIENSLSENCLDTSLCWTEQFDKTCKMIIFNPHTLKEIKRTSQLRAGCYLITAIFYDTKITVMQNGEPVQQINKTG